MRPEEAPKALAPDATPVSPTVTVQLILAPEKCGSVLDTISPHSIGSPAVYTNFFSSAITTVLPQNFRQSPGSMIPLLSINGSRMPTVAIPCPGKSCKSNN